MTGYDKSKYDSYTFFFYRTLIYALGLNISDAFGKFGTNGWYHWTIEEQWAVFYAQNFMLLVFVWYLGKRA